MYNNTYVGPDGIRRHLPMSPILLVERGSDYVKQKTQETWEKQYKLLNNLHANRGYNVLGY